MSGAAWRWPKLAELPWRDHVVYSISDKPYFIESTLRNHDSDETSPAAGPALGDSWWTVLAWVQADDGSAIRMASFHWLRPVLRARGEEGRTVLMTAAWHGKLDAFNALLEQGASLSDEDVNGVNAQAYVRQFGKGRAEGVLRMSVRLALLEHTADEARTAKESQAALPHAGGAKPRSRRTPPL